jgi:AraC-like DNA-binding protein
MISSIEAYRYLRATMTECSQKAGWRSPITQIALDCGFTNQTHFAAAFRRLVGSSPRAYRQNISR